MNALVLERNQANTVKFPIARISFKLDTSIYQKVGNELKRVPNTYIRRNTTHDVVQMLDNETFVLATGEIVKSFSNNSACITFGKLFIQEDGVNVYSRNGLLLRKVVKGQQFMVYDIQLISKNEKSIMLYKINPKEMIMQQPGVEFVMGYFKPSKNLTVSFEDETLNLETNKSYAFHDIKGDFIKLNGLDNLWINLADYKGTIEKV